MQEEFKGWDNFAKTSLIDCAKFIIEEGHQTHEYTYCERSIHNTIVYLNSKRREEIENKGVL